MSLRYTFKLKYHIDKNPFTYFLTIILFSNNSKYYNQNIEKTSAFSLFLVFSSDAAQVNIAFICFFLLPDIVQQSLIWP